MSVFHQFCHFVETIEYKPGWTIKASIMTEYDYVEICVKSPPVPDAYGRSSNLSPIITMERLAMRLIETTSPGEWIHRIYDLIEKLEKHERDEWFKVGGRIIFNPHKNDKKGFPG